MVEVLEPYLNPDDQGERIPTLLKIVPETAPRVNFRTPRTLQHRLSSVQIETLISDYQTGATVKTLAERFAVHRDTVCEILNRRGIVRRERGVPADRITDVIAAYRAGSSLDKIGSELGVATGTVAAALRKAGEKIRPAVRFKLKAREEPKPRQQAERVAP